MDTDKTIRELFRARSLDLTAMEIVEASLAVVVASMAWAALWFAIFLTVEVCAHIAGMIP